MDEASEGVNKQRKWPIVLGIGSVLSAILLLSLWVLLHDTDAPAAVPHTSVTTLKAPKVGLTLFATGLTSPTAIVAPKDQTDRRLFVLEQAGRVRSIDKDGQLQPQPFLDISDRVLNQGEMGLLGLAFGPGDTTKVYINYIDKAQETVVASYQVLSKTNTVDPASEKILLKVKQPYVNHNGGDLQFGPDGYLYIALGDGGSGGDPENRAQSKDSLFGKILRIDVSKGDPYTIPSNNPFVNQAGTQPEIWAYGLRNPWRISFDSATGDLYIADVGQGTTEEVDVQPASSQGGENYGWRCYEGNHTFNGQGCLDASHYVTPAFEYTHEEGRCSITGGSVYRGRNYPALTGKYFYGDFCNGQLFYAEKQGDTWQQTLVAKTPYAFSTFGQDSHNELYVADYSTGSIYNIIDTAN